MKSLDDYLAVGDGVADDTIKIQAALDAEYALYIPSKPYRITQPLIQRKVMRIEGDGHASKIVADFATTQLGAWIVNLTPGGVRTGGSMERFSIDAPCPALRFDLSSGTANYISRWSIRNIRANNTVGGYALELFNPTNNDGFFCTTIADCLFMNGGIHLPRCGDSVNIERNTITGPGNGIDIYAVQGANKNVIRDNNITAQGRAIHCGQYMWGTTVQGNNIEQSAGTSDYCILFEGLVGTLGTKPTIVGNSINGWNKVTGALIGMTQAQYGVIDDNNFAQCGTAIYLTGSTSGVRIGRRNTSTCTTLLTNQGTGNILE